MKTTANSVIAFVMTFVTIRCRVGTLLGVTHKHNNELSSPKYCENVPAEAVRGEEQNWEKLLSRETFSEEKNFVKQKYFIFFRGNVLPWIFQVARQRPSKYEHDIKGDNEASKSTDVFDNVDREIFIALSYLNREHVRKSWTPVRGHVIFHFRSRISRVATATMTTTRRRRRQRESRIDKKRHLTAKYSLRRER